MARTQQLMTRDAARDVDPNAVDAPDAPPAADEDNNVNLPNGEEDDEARALDIINVSIRTDMIAMYICVLGFKEGTAIALYNDQQITNFDPFCELDDPTIKELCHQIGKEGHPVSMISQNRLKLLVFWAKHMWRTLRGVDDLSKVDYDQDIKHLQAQKAYEDSLNGSKKPNAPKMTLTPATVVASFTQMKMHLAKRRGTTGLPLEYVVLPKLKRPHDAPEDGP